MGDLSPGPSLPVSKIVELDGQVIESQKRGGRDTSKFRGAKSGGCSPSLLLPSSSDRIVLCVLTESLSFAETLSSPEPLPRGSDNREDMLVLLWLLFVAVAGDWLDFDKSSRTGDMRFLGELTERELPLP